MCRWTDELHQHVEYEVSAAYHSGWSEALAHVAAAHTELTEADRAAGQQRHTQHVAERIADFERCARDMAEQLYGEAWWA